MSISVQDALNERKKKIEQEKEKGKEQDNNKKKTTSQERIAQYEAARSKVNAALAKRDAQIYASVKKDTSVDANDWAQKSTSLLKEMEDYYGGGWKANDESLLKSYDERANALLARSSEWRRMYAGNAEAISTIESVEQALRNVKRYASDSSKYYAQWDTEDAYNAYTAKQEEYEKKWGHYTKEADFEKYAKQGASIENPAYEDTDSWITFGNWRPFGEKVGNVVTFSRDNIDKIEADMSQADSNAELGHVVGDYRYKYMTEDEVSIYNYLLAKNGEEAAQEYLDDIEENLNARQGREWSENIESMNPVGKTIAYAAFAPAAGLDQAFSGTKQFFTKEQPTSATQFASAYNMENLADAGPQLAGQSLGQIAYSTGVTIGNMAPSVLVSAALGGAGVAPFVTKTVNAGMMGVSSAGNAYKWALDAGYDKGRARGYSLLVGASEAALQYALGGIGKATGLADDIILAKVAKIDNVMARFALNGAVKIGNEIAEEELQAFLEPLFETLIFKVDYDAPEFDELLQTALVTALSTGLLEGGDTVSSTFGANKAATNYYSGKDAAYEAALQKYLKDGNTADAAAKLATADVKKTFTGEYTKQRVNESAEALVAEALELDPENKRAQNIQKKLADNKNVSAYSLGLLSDQNDAAIMNLDKQAIAEATAKRLTDLGEEGDVQAIAAALTKRVAGEDLTKADLRVLSDSLYAERVANELNPENIRSGGYTSDWTGTIDTSRINVDEYSRLVEAAQLPQEGESVEQVESVAPAAETPLAVAQSATESVVQPKTEITLENAAKAYGTRSQVFIDNYEEGQDLDEYSTDFRNAYDRGRAGLTLEATQGYAKFMSDPQIRAAYNAGVEDADAWAVSRETSNKKRATSDKASGKTWKRGAVSSPDGVTGDELQNVFGMNDTQVRAHAILSRIAEITGIDIVLTKSEVDADGRYIGAHGEFRHAEPGKIYIDINAGLIEEITGADQLSKYTMMRTFSHEFTHFLEYHSPKMYNEFKRLVFATIDQRHKDGLSAYTADGLIQRKMLNSKGQQVRDYNTASHEVLADAMTEILPETTFMETLANEHQNIFQKLLSKLKEFIANLKEHFAGLADTHTREAQALMDGVKYAEGIAAAFDKVALSAVHNFQSTVATNESAAVKTEAKADTDIDVSTEAVPVEDVVRGSYRSLAEAAGFTAEEYADGSRFFVRDGAFVNKVTVEDIENSPIGALINYSLENGDISKEDATKQKKMFAEVCTMACKTNDFSMTMQFMGSAVFTGMKANADKQYGTTYDFPSICTKTQAVIDAMSARMVKLGRGLSSDEIVSLYQEVFASGNPVPCPECYVFSRWIGIGGLLDNIKKYQDYYGGMTVEEAAAAYRDMRSKVEAFASDQGLTFGKAKGALTSKLTKEYNKLKEKIEKAQNQGETVKAADQKRLDDLEPQMNTVKAMTWLENVYFADSSLKKVNPRFMVPNEVLFDLNNGEAFATQYPEAWAFRTTQGAGYGKAITPYAEARLGEGILVTNNTTTAIKNKAGGVLDNYFLQQRGKLDAKARKALETARAKQKNQAFIGGQRFQATSDARYENASDYLIAAIEMQAMRGMVQAYTKVDGAVPAFSAWGFSINQSLMPLGGGLNADGTVRDTAVGGMNPKIAFDNRRKHETAGTITIGVNDNHIRTLFKQGVRDFIIPYHASGGKADIVAAFRSIQEGQERKGEMVRSTDYSRTQGDKVLSDEVLRWQGKTEAQIQRIHEIREARIAILSGGKKNKPDMTVVRSNRFLSALYDKLNGGEWDGVQIAKGKIESQIFPNEFWDQTVSYKDSGQITRDYLEYCNDLGFLHRFSGTVPSNGRLVPVSGYDENGNRVQLTDLAYKYDENGQKTEQVEDFFWKVLTDRRMYDNAGNYLPQKIVTLNDTTKETVTGFAKNNYGRQYNKALSLETANALAGEDIVRQSERVTDEDTLDFLNKQLRSGDVTEVYRAMAVDDDGNLYPPMAGYVRKNGKKVINGHPSVVGEWEQSTESIPWDAVDEDFLIGEGFKHFETPTKDYPNGRFERDNTIFYRNKNGEWKAKFHLDKDNGTTVDAAYAPYIHTSLSVLNDQFTSAYTRDNLVVVRGYVPNSEVYGTNGKRYQAKFADKPVGKTKWHSGVVAAQMPETRTVILSRYFMPIEIVDDSVMAQKTKEMMKGNDIEIPFNVVTPGQRRAMEAIGIRIGEARGLKDPPRKADVRYSSRDDYAPTFYSQMGKVIDALKPGKYGAASVVNTLRGKGVKAEEIKWSGIEQWLAGKKSVSKEDLQAFVAGSMLQVEEEILDNRELPYSKEHAEQIAKYEAERDTVAENLKAEWKRIVGTDIPIAYFGAGLEHVVVEQLIVANTAKKADTEAGYQYRAKKAALQRMIENSDDYFGYDNERMAFREAVRNPDEFLRSMELTSFEKGVLKDFIKAREAYVKEPGIPLEDQKALIAIAASADRFSNRIAKVKSEHRAKEAKRTTKWGQYKINGGTNYRELLFRLPDSDYSNDAMYMHWEKRYGVLAHARMQDIAVDGGKMLFVEEIQSDWHNEGHKKGYSDKPDMVSEANTTVKLEDGVYYLYYGGTRTDASVRKAVVERSRPGWGIDKIHAGLVDMYNDRHMGDHNVPEAPFSETYHEFVMKRLLRMAAEEGYDSIGWTPADIQMDRWNRRRKTNAEMRIEAKNPDAIAFEEAYQNEYDRRIPKFMRKHGEQWGAKVGKTTVETGKTDSDGNPRFGGGNYSVEVWSMPITDEMRESVLYEGQTMYQARDEEYMEAVNSGDMDTAQQLVNEAAQAAGYNVEAWHGTRTKEPFTVFHTSHMGGNYGAHFTTNDPEGDPDNPANVMGGAGMYHVFLKAQNPFETMDMYADDRYWQASEIDRLAEEVGTPRAEEIRRELRKEYPLDDEGAGEEYRYSGKGSNQNDAEFNRLEGFMRELLKEGGYDSLAYQNEMEGEYGNEYDYCILYPEQIKSADPVVYDDNGNIIPLSERFNEESNDIRYQDRSETLTDRDILEMAANEIHVDGLTPGEQSALDIMKKRLDTLHELQNKRVELGRLYRKQMFVKETRDPVEAEKTKNRMNVVDEQIQRAGEAVLDVEDKAVLKQVLQKARKVIETKDREHTNELISRMRDRMNNAAAIKKYRERIQKDVGDMSKWITKPDYKDARKHVPDVLKNSVIDFISAIDMTSKRQLRGGEATKADEAFVKQLNAVKTAIKQNIDISGLYSGYNDLPPFFMDVLQTYIDDVQTLVKVSNGEFVINRMTSEELKTLAKITRNLKMYITQMNQFHANAMFQHVTEAGESSIEHLKELKPTKHNGAISNYLMWQQMRPAYAFERFGRGGMSIYDELRSGQAKLAFNVQEVVDFSAKTYTEAEVKAWEKQTKTFTLGGDTVKVPVSYLMGLYELYKQDDSRRHMLSGGLRVATYNDGKKKVADVGHELTQNDIETMIGELSDRQKEVADALQKYMATTGAEWGNYVSMARFGEELFGNPQYYPINSDGRHLAKDSTEEQPSAASLYALLNMSFTKQRNELANNRIVLYSIFDVFSNHMASMSQYNALALPVLDAVKWFNYESKMVQDKKVVRLAGLREEMARVYGTPEESKPGSGRAGYAETFVANIIKAFNGTEAQGSPYDAPMMKILHHYNAAQVSFNLSVVLKQPLAITRAGLLIDGRSIIAGMQLSPASIKKNIQEMRKHSGIAAWKALGFYDVNVSSNVSDLIKHDGTFTEKLIDFGMKGAEEADTRTWAGIWAACKHEVTRTQKLKPTDEGFYEAVTKLFEDIIYKTQVVDSALTKSEFMRSKGFGARLIGSFQSEPITTASMLIDGYDKYQTARMRGLNHKQAWQQAGKYIGRVTAVYAIGVILEGAMQSAIDAYRDDDDYETFVQKFLDALPWNLVDSINPLNKIPLISDVFDVIKELARIPMNELFGLDIMGNVSQTPLGQITGYITKATEIVYGKITGDEDKYTWYAAAYKLLQAASGLTGLPGATAMREVVTAWNNIVGYMAPSLKVKTYDSGPKSSIGYAYADGYLTLEEAMKEMVDKGAAKDENEAYFALQGYASEDYSRYDKVFEAVKNGESIEGPMKELTDHGYTKKDVIGAVKTQIGKWYRGTEDEPQSITKQQAIDMLKKHTDMSDKEIDALVLKWTAKVVTGIDYDEIKQAYLDGKITSSRAIEMRVKYGGVKQEDAKETVLQWQCEKDTGVAYEDIADAYVEGKISRSDAVSMWQKYGGYTADEARDKAIVAEFKYENSDLDWDASVIVKYRSDVEPSGIGTQVYDRYLTGRKSCKGTDLDGDGKTDSGSVKVEVLQVIDSLPISNAQKDVLYRLNGWSERTMYEAPWH